MGAQSTVSVDLDVPCGSLGREPLVGATWAAQVQARRAVKRAPVRKERIDKDLMARTSTERESGQTCNYTKKSRSVIPISHGAFSIPSSTLPLSGLGNLAPKTFGTRH